MHFISPAASATAAPMMAPMALSATVKAIFVTVLEENMDKIQDSCNDSWHFVRKQK